MSLARSLAAVRAAVLKLDPTGADGFEGLVAELLAEWTGLHVRSARAGYQAGHDGGTVRGPISLLFEAKRYDASTPKLRDLMGELEVVLQDHPDLDLYVVASTRRLGSLFEQRMGRQADAAGAEILLLDWDGDLPLLATFVAGEPRTTLAWFERHEPSVDRRRLAAAMDAIKRDPGFEARRAAISNPLSAETLGVEALRAKVTAALDGLFRERASARRRFRQHLAPADAELGAIERGALTGAVDAWYRGGASTRFLAVLGDEGVGKSWTVPQWWLAQGADRPILLVAPSSFVRERDVQNGRRFLAELIAFTLGEASGATVERWEARLRRWSTAAGQAGLFLVVLDGLNEATGVDWPALVDSVAEDLPTLSVRLAVTCRRGFFADEIRDRLSGARAYSELPVVPFSAEELRTAAAARDVDIFPLSEEVRAFIANPRIFAVAAGLLPELAAGRLTVPRLLMMAWRHRMSERGHLVAHNDHDMRELVASHGRAIREGQTTFQVNLWRRHSSRVHRSENASLDDDLTEVVQGPFSEPIPDRPGEYRIRDHAFGFALGLALLQELRVAGPDARPNVLADALDQLSGFERTAEILAAAVAVAMLDPAFDPPLCRDLLCSWLDLQNLRQRDLEEFAAYAADRPEVYLDVVERVQAVAVCPNRMWPVAALREATGDPRVASLVRARCRAWMGDWHMGDAYPPVRTDDERHRAALEERARERIDLIAASIEALGEAERSAFGRACTRVDNVRLTNVASVVPFLLAGQPLSDCVDGLVGWMLAIEVAQRPIQGGGISWVFDLNAADHEATSAACMAAGEGLLRISTCRATRNAAARVFGMSGTREGERRCREVFEMPPALVGPGEADGDADPLDPNASPSPALPPAVMDDIDPAAIRSKFGMGPHDFALDRVALLLARFNPDLLVDLWRNSVAGIGGRDAMGVRQLVIELPRLSPLFRIREIAAARAILMSLGEQGHFLRHEANVFAAGYLAQAILPHLDGDAQLDLLAGLPADLSWPDDIHQFLVPASPPRFEDALASALAGGAPGAAGPVLLFAVRGRQEMTPAAVSLVARCLDDPAPYVRSLAFRCATAGRLEDVLRRHLAGTWTARDTQEYEAYFGSVALAQAARIGGVAMPLDRMGSQARGYAAATGAREDQNAWLATLADAVGRAGAASLPASAGVARSATRGGSEASFPYFVADRDEVREDTETSLADMLQASQPDAALSQRREDNAALTRRIDELLASLRAMDLTFLADAPSTLGFDEAAVWGPERLREFARSSLAFDAAATPSRLRNLAMSLVPALSRFDVDLAADLYCRMFIVPSFVPARVGPEPTPFDLDVLFAAADASRFAAVRRGIARRAASDASLARFVLAATLRGKEAVVHEMARESLSSGRPGEAALGMTLLGFCDEVDDEAERLLRPFLDGQGFLSEAARSAMQAHATNRRARHWAAAAEHADDPADLWRYGELAAACSDYRYASWYKPVAVRGTSPWSRFARHLERGLASGASKVASARKKTLYGSERPHDGLAALIGHDDGLSSFRAEAPPTVRPAT